MVPKILLIFSKMTTYIHGVIPDMLTRFRWPLYLNGCLHGRVIEEYPPMGCFIVNLSVNFFNLHIQFGRPECLVWTPYLFSKLKTQNIVHLFCIKTHWAHCHGTLYSIPIVYTLIIWTKQFRVEQHSMSKLEQFQNFKLKLKLINLL